MSIFCKDAKLCKHFVGSLFEDLRKLFKKSWSLDQWDCLHFFVKKRHLALALWEFVTDGCSVSGYWGWEEGSNGYWLCKCIKTWPRKHQSTSFIFPNNIGAKHFLRAKALNSSNLTFWYVEDQVITKKEPENKRLILKVPIVAA